MANKSNYFPRRSSHFKNYKVILSGRGSQKELKQNILDFLNHKYIIKKIEEQENNPEFIMELYDIINEMNMLVRKTIKNKKAPDNNILTEEEAFRRVIEYNR